MMKNTRHNMIKRITSLFLLLSMIVGLGSFLGSNSKAAAIKITYDLRGGWISPTNSSTSYTKDLPASKKLDASAYYPGKILIGWATTTSRANSGDIDFAPGAVASSITADKKLYAVYGTLYTFFNSDGSRKISEATVPCGKKIDKYIPSVSKGSDEVIIGVKLNGDVITPSTINNATAPTTLYLRKIKRTVRYFKDNTATSADAVVWKYITLTDAQLTKLCNMTWPLKNDYSTSSKFQWRKKPSVNASNCHEGWDIGGQLNNTIFAALPGKVQYVDNNAAGSNPAAGKYIEIDHGDSIVTRYLHCNSFTIDSTFVSTYSERSIPSNKRISVSKGAAIAKCGSTGNASTAPHLHFCVTVNGTRVDAEQFMWLSYERDLKRQGKTVTTPSERYKTYDTWKNSSIIR